MANTASASMFNVSLFKCVDKDDLSFWKSVIQCQDTKDKRLRVNVDTEDGFWAFKKAIEAEAKVHFTVERSKPSVRYQCSRVFRCHHGTHNLRADAKNPRKKTG